MQGPGQRLPVNIRDQPLSSTAHSRTAGTRASTEQDKSLFRSGASGQLPKRTVSRNALSRSVHFHLQQLEMTPRERRQKLRRRLAFKIAVCASIRFAASRDRILSIEGEIRVRVSYEYPVSLCGFGKHQRERRQVQLGKVQ